MCSSEMPGEQWGTGGKPESRGHSVLLCQEHAAAQSLMEF